MNLRDKYSGREYTIAEMVERELDGTDYERGELETISASVRNIHRFLGRLTGALYASDSLPKSAVLELASSGYEEAAP